MGTNVLELGESLASLLTEKEAHVSTLLAVMGVVHQPDQVRWREKVTKEGSAYLEKIDAALDSGEDGKVKYLSGGDLPGDDDYKLLENMRSIFQHLLLPEEREKYPSALAWCRDVRETLRPKDGEEPEQMHVFFEIGTVREGGLIDCRATPRRVRRDAEVAKEINKDAKKGPSQRELEKAAKAKTQEEPKVEVAGPFSLQGGPIPADMSPENKIERVSAELSRLGIEHKTERHAKTDTVAQLLDALSGKEGIACKNLFLRAKKGRTKEDSRLWLVAAAHDTEVNLKSLTKKLGYPSKGELRFGRPEHLSEALQAVQGEVTPFALVNDPECKVNVVLDAKIAAPGKALWFHPLRMWHPFLYPRTA